MDPNKNSPRERTYSRRSYSYYSTQSPDFFSKKRMICDCNLEFLDAGAYAKHMKNKHPEKNSPWIKQISTNFQFKFSLCCW